MTRTEGLKNLGKKSKGHVELHGSGVIVLGGGLRAIFWTKETFS